eukprot:GHVR01000695.1.p1 GENE.GHVR01000695.1~~GHVR01000695.1.p1  ORF type:complete len:204 (+),score=37.63 GHVR01000695.1:83-694(+)
MGKSSRGPPLLFSGIIGLYISICMWSYGIDDSESCVYTSPSSCNSYAGQDKQLLKYEIVMNNIINIGNYTNKDNINLPKKIAYVDAIEQYYSCQSHSLFNNNNTGGLEIAPQRPKEACVLAGCTYRQCLKISSTCDSNGMKDTLVGVECSHPINNSKVTVSRFCFSLLCSATAITCTVLGVILSRGSTQRSEAAVLSPSRTLK